MARIAYVTIYDPDDPEAFFGRGYYMAQSFKKHFDIDNIYLGRLRKHWLAPYLIAKTKFNKKIFNKMYFANRDKILIKSYARQIARKLKNLNPDVIFSPISPGSHPVTYLDCKQPIFIWDDGTVPGLRTLYPSFIKLSDENYNDAIENEKTVLERCRYAIYSSDWAAKSVIENYNVDPNKVRVISYGANLMDPDRSLEDIKSSVHSRSNSICRLLFVGVEWKRKGLEIAINVTEDLNKRGIKTELTVVGCTPDIAKKSPFVNTIGYLSKATAEGKRKMLKLFNESHFMIMPSSADVTPFAFSEANFHGLPCISSDIAGIPTVIKEGLNGKTFSLQADVSEYSEYIANLFTHPSEYEKLALSSYNEYKTRLNWDSALMKINDLIESSI